MTGTSPLPIRPHAAAFLAANPALPVWWPTRGRAAPTDTVLTELTAAGWPLTRAAVALPDGTRRVVTCVPAAWLAELARRCGATAADWQVQPVEDG